MKLHLNHHISSAHPRIRSSLEIMLQTYREWQQDGTIRIGAGLAYYGIIAIVPMLLVTVGLAEFFFSSADITSFLREITQTIFGEQANQIVSELQNGITNQDVSTFHSAGIIGLAGLFFAATAIFIALHDALRLIWKTDRASAFSVRKYAVSFGVMLVVGATTTAILIAHSIINYARNLLPEDTQVLSAMTGVTSIFAIYIIMSLTVLILLKSFITVKIAAKDLIVSSLLISALMYLGVYGLSIYFSNFTNQSLYGALAGFVLLLLAIYYFAQIFLAGAQLSKVIAYRNGNAHLQKHLKKSDPRHT